VKFKTVTADRTNQSGVRRVGHPWHKGRETSTFHITRISTTYGIPNNRQNEIDFQSLWAFVLNILTLFGHPF